MLTFHKWVQLGTPSVALPQAQGMSPNDLSHPMCSIGFSYGMFSLDPITATGKTKPHLTGLPSASASASARFMATDMLSHFKIPPFLSHTVKIPSPWLSY